MEFFCIICWCLPLSALWFSAYKTRSECGFQSYCWEHRSAEGLRTYKGSVFPFPSLNSSVPNSSRNLPLLTVSTPKVLQLSQSDCITSAFLLSSRLQGRNNKEKKRKMFSLSHPAPCIVIAIRKHNSRGSDTHLWNRLSCSKNVYTSCSLQLYGGYVSWQSMLTVRENLRDFATKFLSNAFELGTSLLYWYSRFPGKLSTLVMSAPLPTSQCQVWCLFKKVEFLL